MAAGRGCGSMATDSRLFGNVVVGHAVVTLEDWRLLNLSLSGAVQFTYVICVSDM